MNAYLVTFVWILLALIASVASVRLGVSVALVEIAVGALAANLPGVSRLVHHTEFTQFLALLGSVLLTFLAGAEIDPVSLRKHLKASLTIGFLSFLVPFLGAFGFAYWILGWELRAAQIAGVSLSTTSVAVVYAVLVETGLSREELGKLILAACFVTDLGTVLALGALFASFGPRLLVFLAVGAIAVALLPKSTRYVIQTLGHRISEPEIKFLLAVLLGLGGLASAVGSEAVLPAYVAGVAVAGTFTRDRVLIDRMRSISFALLTPFFFLRAGALISARALWHGLGVVGILLLVKLGAKIVGVWPATLVFGVPRREGTYLTLLMATGLTFGSIAALFGLNREIITQDQYSQLVTVVVLSAVVPTLIAQRFFQPSFVDEEEEEALGAEDISVIGHRGARTDSEEGDTGLPRDRRHEGTVGADSDDSTRWRTR